MFNPPQLVPFWGRGGHTELHSGVTLLCMFVLEDLKQQYFTPSTAYLI